MISRRAERKVDAPVMPVAGNWYGTTLRVYDPSLDAWHIFWIDPATHFFTPAARPRSWRGHRAGGHRQWWRPNALEFHTDQTGFLPLARGAFTRRRRELATPVDVLARRVGA